MKLFGFTDASQSVKNIGYAFCIKTDGPELLILSKVYRVWFLPSGRVRVIDEEGEAAVYPPEFFVRVEFPSEVEKVLESLQTVAV